jgi:pyrroline-5-carboxylate reductase
MTVRLAIFGGGNMGAALAGGLLAAGWAEPHELAVVEPVAPRRKELVERWPGMAVVDALETPALGAVLAVKPPDVAAAAAAAGAHGVARVLSIAAGVTTASIEAALGADVAVVRAMPNTPALVGAGAAAIAPGRRAGPDDLDWAAGILGAVGIVERVSEDALDAVTGLSGSGPAYFFLVAEALIDAGVLVGLTRPASRALVVQTMLGAGRLLAETGETPEALRAAVTSPGGTTAAGLRALERAGLRAGLLDAVVAATERSRALAGS